MPRPLVDAREMSANNFVKGLNIVPEFRICIHCHQISFNICGFSIPETLQHLLCRLREVVPPVAQGDRKSVV